MTSPFEIVKEFRDRQEYNDKVLAWLHTEMKYQLTQSGVIPTNPEEE